MTVENGQPREAASARPVQKHKRRELARPLIVLRCQPGAERRSFFGYARNLSRGGMFISSINPPGPGTRFNLEFALPADSRRTVTCLCEVVWNRTFRTAGRYQPGMGLKFLEIPEEAACAIDDWAGAGN